MNIRSTVSSAPPSPALPRTLGPRTARVSTTSSSTMILRGRREGNGCLGPPTVKIVELLSSPAQRLSTRRTCPAGWSGDPAQGACGVPVASHSHAGTPSWAWRLLRCRRRHLLPQGVTVDLAAARCVSRAPTSATGSASTGVTRPWCTRASMRTMVCVAITLHTCAVPAGQPQCEFTINQLLGGRPQVSGSSG